MSDAGPPEPPDAQASPSAQEPATPPDDCAYIPTHEWVKGDDVMDEHCKRCGYSWGTVVKLRMVCPARPSAQSTEPSRLMQCPKCDIFSSEGMIRQHLKLVHGEPSEKETGR